MLFGMTCEQVQISFGPSVIHKYPFDTMVNMRGRRFPDLHELLTHGDVPGIDDRPESVEAFDVGPGDRYSEENSIFVCIHLLYDSTVDVCQYVFRGKDGGEIWNGDMLCENCIERDIYELAREGMLVLVSHDDLLDARMKGMDV